MYYYEVWVRSNRYHGQEPLTYASAQRLATGSIVRVELQKELVLGFVSGTSSKPRFKTKPIAEVLDLPALPSHLMKLAAWMQAYYPAPLGILTQQLLPGNLSKKQIEARPALELGPPKTDGLPALTAEQQAAVAAMAERDTYILHGVTGSGKTRVYIELAALAVEAGQSVIILTPEISLTSQLAGRFREVFGERVVVMHSQLPPAERQQAWLSCLRAGTKEPLVVIGTRSALFAPLAKPGLIVLDEAHEAAYKQEQAPQYQAGRAAAYLARLSRAALVLGSATPSLSDYYLAKQKEKSIIKLSGLAQPGQHPATEITVVDRKEHNLFSRSSYLSQPLIAAIDGALARGEQSLLYLNRRGTARLVMCENCGWQADCPHCDLPLTYHGDHHQLRCHSCDYHAPAPASCPKCGHADIVFKTAGTKAIVDNVQRLFPQARIMRFDTDNARAERFERLYEQIRAGEVDILVGTQLLAKGLDLPRLSVLGILLADTSLYLPDFSAQERTFQLISQVLGRVGRGHVAGRAVIQTYHPDHPVLRAAIDGDYDGFYETEMAARQQFLFPPFCYLLKLTVRRASIKAAEAAAFALKSHIISVNPRLRVEGPAPSFYEKLQNKYQWQLVVKAKNRAGLLEIIANLPSGASYDLDPMDLL
ncbi:MAG TPA: primosomal protein N' [Candidatus Saccharimonadales bacterium]|nr:primosomal protein N' [Candidatus Saccharimonadales bacterium]